ncbi:noelin-like [Asterias rubens]|uniref:noelin-like n=1 Tax=Asterias rubens TaxID=7604 RepID=UPI00145547A1|nr:noelin-like [Asterias rubens]
MADGNPLMFMTGAVILLLMLPAVIMAQTQPSAEPTTSGFEVTGERGGDGTCRCTVKSPTLVLCSDYETRTTHQKLKNIKNQINNLTADVTSLFEIVNLQSELTRTFESDLSDVTTTFNLIEGGQLLVTRTEIEGMRRNVRNMASALYTLREWQGVRSDETQVGRIEIIMSEVSNVSKVIDGLIEIDTSEDLAGMQRRVTELSNQLRTCNAKESESVGTAVPDTEDSAEKDRQKDPELWPKTTIQNSCGKLVSISEPYTLRGNLGSNGAWMRDPVVSPDFVCYHSFTDPVQDKQFSVSINVGEFQKGESQPIEGDILHHIIEAAVYNGSLFAYSTKTERVRNHRRNGYEYAKFQNITRIGWTSQSPSIPIFHPGSSFVREIPSETPHDRFAYTGPSAAPKMDLTVDESGLWLIYSNAQEMLVVSKVDEETLEFERTVVSSYPKNRLGNCFIICKKVYCLNGATSYDSRVAFFMDSDSGFEGFVNVPFIIKYGSLSSIEYNPRDQLLYGWDNGHAVVYSLTFE